MNFAFAELDLEGRISFEMVTKLEAGRTCYAKQILETAVVVFSRLGFSGRA
jgi:hypothetical protein